MVSHSCFGVFLLSQLVQGFTLRTWDAAYTLANATVAQMTIDEKIGVVTGTGQFSSRCVGDTHPVARLGIPSICMNDGPAGLRLVKGVTGFPSGINAASTFNRQLIRERGVAIGEEFRAKGVNMLLGPAMDIMRNPKAGRGWESGGPDPYLNGEMAYETIVGVQSVGVMACAKHLIANNQEHWRYGLNAIVDDRTIHEIYWYPFLRSIEADVSSVMCAYNQFNGTSSCHNAALLGPNGLLQRDGFKGFVVSDWGATHDSASDNANAGLDMEQPGDFILIGGGVYNGGLELSVDTDSVPVTRLNQMVTRILAPFYRLGQDSGYPAVNFDVQKPDGSGPLNENVSVRSASHTALARTIAAASAVLLKNNATVAGKGLPIVPSTIRTMAVIGRDAKLPKLDCNSLNECNEGTMSIGWGSGSNSLEFIVPPIDAIVSHVGSSAKITQSLSNDIDPAVVAARGKDVAIVFVNAMSGELGFYDTVVGNMGDRNDLDLWYKGGSLVEKVAAVNSNTVVVVHSTGPVALGWSTLANVTAVIYAGAPGEQTGPSIVDVLYGAVNPSGRLPFSIADVETAYPAPIVYNSGGFPQITYNEKLLLDYRYMDANSITPLFEFGYGLSYTKFTYSNLSITPSGTSYIVKFGVTNTGSVAGTEIPQVYVAYPQTSNEPKRVLRGFESLSLPVGATQSVTITIVQRDLSIWDVARRTYVRPAGTFSVFVGASIKDVRLTVSRAGATMAVQESTDVFSLSDQALSDRLHFIEEIGFGNWGSVWLCQPKGSAADGLDGPRGAKIAVKLVHRSKTSTTAARVRSLWNEMKIIRTFKSDCHPSIIQFHSFIITPSYALVTMAFLPTLVPVEVHEEKAKHWFRFLLSAIEFLHTRGVVHNDIKPANILISSKNLPVLVDFGFAERYDLSSKKKFHSDLSYGTPEYLSPERARGLHHDTRKSDIWSTGCTFFEILVGRTPFENSDGEQFSSKADLEEYWKRTLSGKWVGTWKMSKGIEELLQRMLSPNADLRCTAAEAMDDDYWKEVAEPSTSSNHDLSKLVDFDRSWELSQHNDHLLDLNKSPPPPLKSPLVERMVSRTRSQPKMAHPKPVSHLKKRVAANLSPIKASPPSSPHSSVNAKENSRHATRKPTGQREALSPLGGKRDNIPRLKLKPSVDTFVDKRRGRLTDDLNVAPKNEIGTQRNLVKERVKDWEREKQRLREMEKLEELDRQRDEELGLETENTKPYAAAVDHDRVGTWPSRQDTLETRRSTVTSMFTAQSSIPVRTPPTSNRGSFTLADLNVPRSRSGNDLGLGRFRHSVKNSIDKTVRLYKSSVLGMSAGPESEHEVRQRNQSSWEDVSLIQEANSSLPVIRHAIRNERVAADNNRDRMAIWMANVEKVVEETKLNFASSTTPESLPPIPLAPLSRSTSSSQHPANRSSRLPRRVLAANRIFLPDLEDTSIAPSLQSAPAETAQPPAFFSVTSPTPAATPTRPRRATVSIGSPDTPRRQPSFNMDTGSPSKRKEKSKSHSDLFQRHITPISALELQLLKPEPVTTSHRLSAVLDRSVFITPPVTPREETAPPIVAPLNRGKSLEFDHLSSSPVHIEPYPPRPASTIPLPDTPNRRTLQGVYDRYLASTGVKRLGLGYQSDNQSPVCSAPQPAASATKRNFYSTRRAMPPPVSSSDMHHRRQSVSVDELGIMTGHSPDLGTPQTKDESSGTSFVRRALKAVINGKTASRRLSRAL